MGSLTSDFAGLTTSQIDTALNARWKGGNFSSRVWGNYVRDLPKKLDKTLTVSMTNGWGVDRTVKAMMENIDSGLRNRMTTLVQTEMAHLADEASQLAYERKGVKEYEWLATLELHTCELCGNFDGQTFIVGSKNAKRPIVDSHPNCRCTTVPSVNFPGLKRWSRDPITGKGKRIDSMSFNDWKEKYTDSSMLKKARNSSSDKKQYDRYKSIIGTNNMPKSFDKFQEMKYNDGKNWSKISNEYELIKRWSKADFASEKSFNGHYNKHGDEFPNLTQIQYRKLARKILSHPIDERYLGYEVNGRHVRYDVEQNIFTFGNSKGQITTMFKPDKGVEYYEENKKRDLDD